MENQTVVQVSSQVANRVSIDRELILDTFIAEKDRKQSTLGLFRRTLGLYFDWIEATGRNLNTLTCADINEYKRFLIREGKSGLTISSYLSTIKSFYKWTESKLIYPNIASTVELPKRKREFRHQPLRPAQAKELIEETEQTGSTRDLAIVNLLIRTGLRTIEVVRANVGDITFKCGKRVLMVQGKGRDEKDNFVVLTDKTFAPIARYLSERGATKPNDPLFLSESYRKASFGNHSTDPDFDPRRMTTRSISRIAKNNLTKIGLDDKVFTAHSLRHTAACSILWAGGNLEDCQMTLRHANPATTQIYTSFIEEERRLERSAECFIDNLF